jgi:hypothetical protein
MKTMKMLMFALCFLFLSVAAAAANENASVPGELSVDPSTIISLGVMWPIKGDANKNAAIGMEYRKVGEEKWTEGYPLMRAEDGGAPANIKSPHSYFMKVTVPPGTWRFAGSVWDLQPDTEYELRVTLKDPDGGDKQHVVKSRTRKEPARLGGVRSLYVAPAEEGKTGGDGAKENPFRGFAAVINVVKPGDTVWLLPGIYKEPLVLTKDGEAGKPIVFRGTPAGEAVIEVDKNGVSVQGRKFIAIDGLVIRNAGNAVFGDNASDISVRYCRLEKVKAGVHARYAKNFYVADNVMTGLSNWPRTKGIEPTAGLDIGGQGIVVCRNRISGVADGISCLRSDKPGFYNFAIDFYENEVFDCTDDGIEADYAEWNLRCFRNRLTNVFQGISCQPVRGGPVYVFRNVLYNVEVETFKLHNYGSGIIFAHNTTVKSGVPIMVSTPEKFVNTHFYNNLFIGSSGKNAINFGVDMVNSEFDYNGIAGEEANPVYRWNRKNLPPLEKLRGVGPIQKHGLWFTLPETVLFAAAVKAPADVKVSAPIDYDLRLREGSPAIDVGLPLPGFNDGFLGKAPDLGAYELGASLPNYGPRPDPERVK